MRASQTQLRARRLLAICTALLAVAVAITRPHIYGLADESPDAVDAPIQMFADWSQEWRDGTTTVALFRGSCRVIQGDQVYRANSMVVWVPDRASRDQKTRVALYLEEGVEVQTPTGLRNEHAMWVDLTSDQPLSLAVRGRVTDRPGDDDPLFRRAKSRPGSSPRSTLRQTQLTVPSPPVDPSWRAVQLDPQPGLRRIRVSPRSIAMPFNVQSFKSDQTTPPEQVTLITGGVNIVVDGMTIGGGEGMGAVDLSADRVIIWTDATDLDQFSPDMLQRPEQPFQIYLEGNIVIRRQSQVQLMGNLEVNNVIRATQAYYDARESRALILNAELQSYIPAKDARFRIRAERIRQNSPQSFSATNAWFTTSEMGAPGYRIQAGELTLEPRPLGMGLTEIDPVTGMVVPKDVYWVEARGAQVFVEDVPLLYVPQISTPVENPGIPLVGGGVGQDRIFGTQIRTRWDAFALFGIRQPDGLDARWNLLLDYLSDRGPAIGTDGKYSGIDQYGNAFAGNGLAYYVHDSGLDNLGRDRQVLEVSDPNRGILQWQHSHVFAPYNMKLLTEVGAASDRNVRESYFEKDFDSGKDLDTLAYLRQQPDENWTWSLLIQPTVNRFENNTAWLPRGDLNALGVPLLGGWLNWSSHTSLAYANVNQAVAPTDPNDTFTPLPFYTDANGLVTMTRHELNAPFNLGPVKVSPYVLGEAAYWSDSFTNESIDRLYGRGGVRASFQFWRAFPHIQSEILNLNGLAHKVSLDADYGYAQSSRDLSEIPQWNQFEDNAQERFRERFLTNTFGGVLPPQFDPRFYAVRSQAATSVSAPYHELVDTQHALRLGLSQRLQTKVGPADRPRIKDWMILDLGVTYFPDPNRDNFGENFGLFTTHYTWNVGDRTTIIADSLFDFFNDGQQWWNIGVMSQRSFRGSVYLGIQQVKGGPLDSRIVTGSYSYAMSPKWVSTMSASYDIAQNESRGQSVTITRIGEWMLFHLGANYDWSKNNAGIIFSVEPKLGRSNSTTQLGSLATNPAQR